MRLKKKLFYSICATSLVVLGAVRHIWPEATMGVSIPPQPSTTWENEETAEDTILTLVHEEESSVMDKVQNGNRHKIRGVGNDAKAFPDLQDVQIVAANRYGVRPAKNRADAEHRKSDLVYVGCSPYYDIDPAMRRSIPYLVPRAADMLETIGRNFFDSLYVKGVPLHRIIVTSVLRTDDDVKRLRRGNGNATENSCHRYGTTIDITYTRFNTVCPPGEERRAVRDDTLKYVLSEVLRDLRQKNRCYVKYERKQACFHITTR